jgi:hypothetical protein
VNVTGCGAGGVCHTGGTQNSGVGGYEGYIYSSCC